jgi:hypothetical protein
MARQPRWPITFWTYFNVADEIYDAIRARRDMKVPSSAADFMAGTPGMTLADLEPSFVKSAKEWAKQNNAPWPPYLPWAEEYSNDLHNR